VAISKQPSRGRNNMKGGDQRSRRGTLTLPIPTDFLVTNLKEGDPRNRRVTPDQIAGGPIGGSGWVTDAA
jgi:hypothetical protein